MLRSSYLSDFSKGHIIKTCQFFFQRSPNVSLPSHSHFCFRPLIPGLFQKPPGWVPCLWIYPTNPSCTHTRAEAFLWNVLYQMLSSFPLPTKVPYHLAWAWRPFTIGPSTDFSSLISCYFTPDLNVPPFHSQVLPRLFPLLAVLPKPCPCHYPSSFGKPLYSSRLSMLSPLPPSWSLILWCLPLLSNCLCQMLFSPSRLLRAHIRAMSSSLPLNSHTGPVPDQKLNRGSLWLLSRAKAPTHK